MSLSVPILRPAVAPAFVVFDSRTMVLSGALLVLASLLAGLGLHAAGCLTLKLVTVLPVVACGGGALASLGVLVHCLRELAGCGRA